jgi:hypothetical protein
VSDRGQKKHSEVPVYEDGTKCNCSFVVGLARHIPGGPFDPPEICLNTVTGSACNECSHEYGAWHQHVEEGSGRHRA